MFRKLLLPLDRSSLAEQAIGHAASIARESGATIDIVLVHEPFPFAGYADLPGWDADTTAEQKYLEAVADELKSGAQVTATCSVLRGAPAEMIIRRAREVDADLIVMTSHGRTGFSRTWLGSVADAVMRKSAIPVLMLRPERESETTKRRVAARGVKRILVPMDGSALGGGIVPAAIDARPHGARVDHAASRRAHRSHRHGVRTNACPSRACPSCPMRRRRSNSSMSATTELESVAQRLHEETGITIDSHVVVSGHAAQAIVDQAEALNIDIIAMSTHGRGASRFFLGSVADKVLRSSRIPVLLYRPVEVRATSLTLDEAEVVRQLPSLMPD